jgi:hypothetical protein
MCNSVHCLSAAHDQFALTTYRCLREDMYCAPSLRVRQSPTASSVVEVEQKYTIATSSVPSSVHVSKVEIDLSGGSDDGDLDIDLPELEEFDTYKLPAVQGGTVSAAASLTGNQDQKKVDSTKSTSHIARIEESIDQYNIEHKPPLVLDQAGVNLTTRIIDTQDQHGKNSANCHITGDAKNTNCAGLCSTAEAGVQTKHNRIFKVTPMRLADMSALQQ